MIVEPEVEFGGPVIFYAVGTVESGIIVVNAGYCVDDGGLARFPVCRGQLPSRSPVNLIEALHHTKGLCDAPTYTVNLFNYRGWQRGWMDWSVNSAHASTKHIFSCLKNMN